MIDTTAAPFDRFTTVQRLGAQRRGHASDETARHQLYVGRDRHTRLMLLLKIASRPGLVYQANLTNEIETLASVNRQLPHSRYFPFVYDHGRLADGRVYVVTTFFDELPLATTIGTDWEPDRLVSRIRTALEVAKALAELHRLQIFHLDLNPMNILFRPEKGQPVIRLVDFESSYEAARHAAAMFYGPPTTGGFSAPEVGQQAPDGRADVFSLAAVLYTMLAGYHWSRGGDPRRRIEADANLDRDLREILLRAAAERPEDRYRSIGAFRTALAAYLEAIWPGRQWE